MCNFFFMGNPDYRDLDHWWICFGTQCLGFVVFNLLTLQCDHFSHAADLHTNRRPLHGLHANASFGTALFGQWKSRVDRGYHVGEDIWFLSWCGKNNISWERLMDEWGSVPATKNVYDQENLGRVGPPSQSHKIQEMCTFNIFKDEEAEQNKTTE